MNGTNPSGLTPLEYNLIVKPEKVEEKTKGGLIMPDAHTDKLQWKEQRARVVAVSPVAFGFEPGAPAAEPGDMILIAEYAGGEVTGEDGEKYRIIKDKDVLALIGDAPHV